ncbi:acyl-CoA thioesterase [Cupriavidus sp. 8B]
MLKKASSEVPSSFPYKTTITTRWHDNDVYGHVNNVVYYAYFDTVVNRFLIQQAGLDIHAGAVIGLVVESVCKYHRPLSFPEPVHARMRVGKIGNSSVRFEIALFSDGGEAAAAEGHFVHVYVDRETRRSVPLPPGMRAALAALQARSEFSPPVTRSPLGLEPV